MIERFLDVVLRERLGFYPGMVLLGPRQVGKTTMARAIAATYPQALMLDLERASDRAQLAEPARAVRTAVFIEEQGIARDEEWDALDADAVHAVVLNRLGMQCERRGQYLMDVLRAFVGDDTNGSLDDDSPW